MNTFTITYAYNYRLSFANNYVFSKCGKCMIRYNKTKTII